ncbi:MAG: helix-turn-helix domain-containing protein [Pyrinomonadaceae bacterium]|nr:helix-turn-helix domain-containing protein [Pyrinomonadaceae bacterium]
MRERMASLIEEMLDGRIMLSEAISEFEKIYIEKALERNSNHLSNTAESLGIHRNTLSKRVSEYEAARKKQKRTAARAAR